MPDAQTLPRAETIDRLIREVAALREETSFQAATIELLEAENERLHSMVMEGMTMAPRINA